MKLHSNTDYAIRALRHLHKHDGELQTAWTISQEIDTTYPRFVKIAKQLSKKGLVQAQLGVHGGFKLGRPADKITVYDVYTAMEGDLQINACMADEHRCEHGEQINCKVFNYFCGLQKSLINELSAKTIADFAD